MDALCLLYDTIPEEISQKEKWAIDAKRQVLASIHDHRKDTELVKRVIVLEERLAEIDRLDDGSFGDVEPPSLADVEAV